MIHELENEYDLFCFQRKNIVLGNYEPTEAECDFSLGGSDSENEDLNESVNKLKIDEPKE